MMALLKTLGFELLNTVKAIANGMKKKWIGTISIFRATVRYVKKVNNNNRFNCLYLVTANGLQT